MYYVTPSEGELFKRFNPDLQKRNLENRERRKQEYEDFSAKMIEYSKSDKPSESYPPVMFFGDRARECVIHNAGI